MPIIVSRKGPITIVEDPHYTQEQKNAAWERILMAWIEKNQEQLIAMLYPAESEEQTD